MAGNVISRLFVEFAADTKKFHAAMAEVSKSAREVDRVLKPIKDRAADAGRALTVGFTVPVVAGFLAVTKAGMDFESAFANVRRTVDTNEAGFAKLRTEIRAMALEIPIAATEIANTAAAAGQLGVESQNIAKFTRTMALLGSTTNLAAQEAGESLARFTNITRTPRENIDRLGATLYALDVNAASSAQEITQFGLRIAAAGKVVGLTDAQILAFGASLSSVGIEAEAGGTAISKVFINIAQAVANGGKKLEQFAAVSNMSAADFAKAFKADAAGATTAFIQGLDKIVKSGGNVFGVIEAMGLQEVRLQNALLASANAGDLLTNTLNVATEAYKNNTALTAAMAEKLKTTAAQWELFKNQLKDIAITLFDTLGPVLRETVLPNLRSLAEFAGQAAVKFNALPEEVKSLSIAFLAIGAAVGPLLLVLVKVSSTLVGLASLAVKAGISLAGLQAAVGGAALIGTVKTYGDLQAAIALIGGTSAAATAGLVALAGAVGIVIGLFANWLLRITGLQQSFDGLLKKMVDSIPVLGKWVTGQNKIEAANLGTTEAQKKLVEQFTKYGIAVDAARLNDSAYLAGLSKQVLEREKANIALRAAALANRDAAAAAKAHAVQQADLGKLFATEETERMEKALKKLREELQEASRPADALNVKLREFKSVGATNTELVRAFAKEIVEAAEAQDLHGFAVSGLVGQLQSEAIAFRKVEENTEFLRKFLKDFGNRTADTIEPFRIKEDLPEAFVKNAERLKKALEDLDESDKKFAELGATFEKAAERGVEGLNELRRGVISTIEAARRMRDAGASTKQIIQILGSDLKKAGEDAKLFGIQLDPATQNLIKMSQEADRASKLAKQMEDAWSTAVGNITSGFADGVADMIFEGKKFSVSLVGIFKDLGKSIVKILVTDAFGSIIGGLTKVLGGAAGGSGIGGGLLGGILGKIGLGGILGGGAAGAGAAGAGAGAVGAGAGGAGAGAGLAALATNPITIAAAAAITAGLLIKKFVGQGRKTADEFVQNVENPFGRNLSAIVDAFDAAKTAGTLTVEQAKTSRDALASLWSNFLSASNEFASQGETQNKVVQQAFKSLGEYFGPNLTNVFSKMDSTIAALEATAQNATAAGTAANAPGTSAGIPQTGRAQSASEIFAAAVTRFEQAVDRTGGGAGGVTVQSTYSPQFTFYGVPESLEREMREIIEPALLRDLENNTRGITQALLAILSNAQSGGVSTVPQTA